MNGYKVIDQPSKIPFRESLVCGLGIRSNSFAETAMKFSRLMLCVVMALLTSAESGAALTSDDNIYSGNDLLAACAMAEEVNPSDEAALGGSMGEVVLNSLRSGMCVGHVAGLMYLVSRANLGICVPEQATEGQGLSVVVRYMRQHPEELREDFRSIILSAMRTAWPCRL